MLKIDWNEIYCSGISLLDTQNYYFVEMLNLLFENQQNSRTHGLFGRIFHETVNHLQEHFQEEERFYKEYALQDFDLHQEQHQHFLETLNHMEPKALEEGTHDSLLLCEFLRDWTIFHILKVDRNTVFDIKNSISV